MRIESSTDIQKAKKHTSVSVQNRAPESANFQIMSSTHNLVGMFTCDSSMQKLL